MWKIVESKSETGGQVSADRTTTLEATAVIPVRVGVLCGGERIGWIGAVGSRVD